MLDKISILQQCPLAALRKHEHLSTSCTEFITFDLVLCTVSCSLVTGANRCRGMLTEQDPIYAIMQNRVVRAFLGDQRV